MESASKEHEKSYTQAQKSIHANNSKWSEIISPGFNIHAGRNKAEQKKKDKITHFLQSQQTFLNSFCFSAFPALLAPSDTWIVHKDREENC